MATVNKASLRTEFDALKARFESLCAEGKMPPESRALVDALLMLFELLMAVFMEKHTPKSPANSGLPPSQSPNDATARTRPGAKGTILTQGERELPPIPPRQKGQRGKVAKSDAHNLWERMKKYEKAVLRFAKHPDVAFTNNRAERDLRMSKVKQKVSGCFRTRKYAEAYCRISSYLQSMANQGYNPLVAIQIALAGRAVDNLPE